MSHDHPIMQHLQGLLSGTIPMAQDPQQGALGAQPGAPAAPFTDHAIPMDPGGLGRVQKTPGGFAGTSPLQPAAGVPSALPSPLSTDGAATPHPNGMSFGDSMAKLMSGGMPGLAGQGQPQVVQPTPMRPGNFNYMDVLSNTQKAMPQRDQWKTGGPY